MKGAKKKLCGRLGFTLAETLMALLILLMVSTIVATGIPSARNAYEKAVLSANAQLLMSTTTSALRDELGTAWDISAKNNVVTYFSADTGAKSELKLGTYEGTNGKQIDTIVIQEYLSINESNPESFNTQPISIGTQRPLVSGKASTGDLSVTYETIDYSYNNTNKTGSVIIKNLTVKNGASEMLKLAQLEIPVIAPRPTPISS